MIDGNVVAVYLLGHITQNVVLVCSGGDDKSFQSSDYAVQFAMDVVNYADIRRSHR